jgi:YidC/Oxa1 family membrane protein insertase
MYTWFYPIAAILQPLLTFFFELTHDWGLAIIVFTLFIKSALFLLNLRVARQQVKQAKLQPHLQELRKQTNQNPEMVTAETFRLYKKHGIKPISTLLVTLLQMPVFMGMYGHFKLHGGSMSSVLVPWVTTLAQSDSLHIMPWLAVGLTFISKFTLCLARTMDLSDTNREKAIVKLKYYPKYNNNGSIEKGCLG